MENASKALIIAGAILLAILLISLGIMIFNQAQDTVSNSGMTEAEKSSFNNKFLKYEGIQKGTVVKSMINEVISSNADSNNTSAGRTVTVKVAAKVNGVVGAATDVTKTSSVKTSSSYKVEITSYDKGAVKEITATEQ